MTARKIHFVDQNQVFSKKQQIKTRCGEPVRAAHLLTVLVGDVTCGNCLGLMRREIRVNQERLKAASSND